MFIIIIFFAIIQYLILLETTNKWTRGLIFYFYLLLLIYLSYETVTTPSINNVKGVGDGFLEYGIFFVIIFGSIGQFLGWLFFRIKKKYKS